MRTPVSRPLPKLMPGAEHDRKSTRLSHERAMTQEMNRQLRNCTSVNVQLEKSTPSKTHPRNATFSKAAPTAETPSSCSPENAVPRTRASPPAKLARRTSCPMCSPRSGVT